MGTAVNQLVCYVQIPLGCRNVLMPHDGKKCVDIHTTFMRVLVN